LAAAELAFNETDNTLYYGAGNSAGQATQILPIGGVGAKLSVADTPPANPINGQLWWDSAGALLYVWYNDGTSSQWVNTDNAQGASAPATTLPLANGTAAVGVSTTYARADHVHPSTMNSNLTISNTNPAIVLNAQISTQPMMVQSQMAGIARWGLYLGDGSAETGGGVGSDLVINALTDAGGFSSQPFRINRQYGYMALGPNMNGAVDNPGYDINMRCTAGRGALGLRSMVSGGTGYTVTFFNASNSSVGAIVVSDSSIAYNTTSDIRLKQTVRQFDPGPIIDALQPIEHNWTDHHDVWQHGLSAQDAHAIYPEAVTAGRGEPGDDDFVPWGIDYSKLTPLLLAEIKALRIRVAALEAIRP
jgi:hypothetical protein